MTAYAASVQFSLTSVSSWVSVSPGSTYQIRVARVEVSGSGSGNISFNVAVYSSALAGGTTLTPLTMRAGAPATSATVKTNATLAGAAIVLHSEGIATVSGADPVSMNSSYSPPFDLIMASGSTIVVNAYAASGSLTCIIYYEELRLQWSG